VWLGKQPGVGEGRMHLARSLLPRPDQAVYPQLRRSWYMEGNPFRLSALLRTAESQALFWALGSQQQGTPCPQTFSSAFSLTAVRWKYRLCRNWGQQGAVAMLEGLEWASRG